MGYYSTYKLEANRTDRDAGGKLILADNMFASVSKALERVITEDWGDIYFTGDCSWGFYTEAPEKWPNLEEDMVTLSKTFPDILFTLTSQGEDYDDMWKGYFLNGKVQWAPAKPVVYDEFDENKLEECEY